VREKERESLAERRGEDDRYGMVAGQKEGGPEMSEREIR
jgi:hypothetical protein